jgi:hypothetical protein
MRRIPTACFSSVAAGLIAAAPASASDHDEQVWTSATATTALSPKVDTTLELHSRYTDDVSRVGQVLIRPSVTYKLPRGWSVTAGYVYVRTRFENTAANDEHRSWGRLREGAESYAKDLGQRYSPVRLMCSHPNGETWASRSGAIGSVAKIVKLEHAWRRLDGRNDDGFQVAPFPG